ncbi:type II toxin-antitoxin system RelE family toxin [Teichococcus aestuarii]|uniref:Plasmid stabilization protein n=1 Tax=Teichococcus aestuarii TaxID=568898 RepID=A0A2U1UXX2_9PROT|nr:type II toxin-antitoxin system RelE/ParE family toxin [Pseudoroseomonas aestuarii]PWC26503.1 plasmid stabilization protein [Pseudoroseomonas aestuarii]
MPLIFSRSAVKALRTMPRREAGQMMERLEAIAADPAAQHPSVIAMQGEPPGRFRLRQGDWRAVFRIEDAEVVVDRIGHRREVYD